MDYTCFNCEELIKISEVLATLEDNNCPYCQTYLHLEIYDSCTNCDQYYLNTFSLCPECFGYNYSQNFIEKDEELPLLKYVYIDSEEKYLSAIDDLNYMAKIALDTEGNSLSPFDNELFLIQLGNTEIVYIFDFNWHEKLG